MRSSTLTSLAFMSSQAAAASAPCAFTVPPTPGKNAAWLDPSPVSFSYPFATLQGYFPGMTLTMKCMSTFKDLTGVWPAIRIGGTSEDYGTFDPNLTVPNVATGVAPTGQAITTYGPLLMRLIVEYKGTIVWGLNRGMNNISNTIEAAKAAVREIPSLYALELGNEPAIFAGLGFPVASTVDEWTPETEAESNSNWQMVIGKAIKKKNMFQAASYYSPPNLGWGAESYFEYANASASPYTKVFSHHNYPQSAVSKNQDPPDVRGLMSHVNVTANVGLYKNDVKVAAAHGFDYVFGETNSVSGNGQPGQGATMGTGLWVLDYALQAASVGIKRSYFHQGTPGKSYYVWFNETGVRSPFYGGYVAAQAMAGGAQIVSLDDGTTKYAGYSVHSSSGKALKVVLVNTDFYDGVGTRPVQQFHVNGLRGSQVQARRLTAKSTLSRQDEGDAPVFAGRSIADNTCKFAGSEKLETFKVTGGGAVFNLAASEALLITLA
ncbi:hypothetical protein FALCPG4_014886 [Fusarium falciforme]